MYRTPIWFSLAVLCLVTSLHGQESAAGEQSSQEALQLEYEHQTQKVKLLQNRVQLLKEFQKVEVDQAKLRIKTQNLEGESLQHKIESAAANVEAEKQNYERTKKLYERNVIAQGDLARAKSDVALAEFEHKQAVTAAKRHTQELESLEHDLKRLELQGAIKVNQGQLELLEAEFQLKALKLALQKK